MQSYPQLITPQPIKPWMAFGSFLTIPNGGLLTSKPTRTWSLSLPHLTQTCLWFIWFWSFLLLLVLYDDDLNYIYKLYIYIFIMIVILTIIVIMVSYIAGFYLFYLYLQWGWGFCFIRRSGLAIHSSRRGWPRGGDDSDTIYIPSGNLT
jgi:hypothetical protein